MKRGFSIVEILVSLVLFSLLSTSLLLFLEGYMQARYLEKCRFEGFRLASFLMENEINRPPLCLDAVERLDSSPWGWAEVHRQVFKENATLIFVEIQVHKKEYSSVLTVLRRVVECR